MAPEAVIVAHYLKRKSGAGHRSGLVRCCGCILRNTYHGLSDRRVKDTLYDSQAIDRLVEGFVLGVGTGIVHQLSGNALIFCVSMALSVENSNPIAVVAPAKPDTPL